MDHAFLYAHFTIDSPYSTTSQRNQSLSVEAFPQFKGVHPDPFVQGGYQSFVGNGECSTNCYNSLRIGALMAHAT